MQTLLLRFDHPATVDGWIPINDAVMGGLSTSQFRDDPAGHAVFSGNVALERNGGFASVRAAHAALGSPDTRVYALTVLGDGKCYTLNLRMDEGFDGVNYKASFAPPAGQWSEVRLPLEAFTPSFRGRPVRQAPPLNPACVRQVGLMIADRQVGPFSLAVRRIACE